VVINGLLCVLFWALHFDFFGVVLAGLISSFISTVWAGWALLTKVKPAWKFNPALMKDLFGYGMKIYLASILLFLHQRVDLLIVAMYLTPANMSFYSLASNIGQLLWKMPNAITGLLLAEVSKRETKEAHSFTAAASRHTFVILILSSIFMGLVAMPVVRIFYGGRYVPLVQPLLILLPGIVTMGVARILVSHFYAQGRPEATLTAAIICAIVNAGLNFALVPRYGIAAAALTSSITYTIYLGWLAFEYYRYTDKNVSRLFLWDRGDFGYYRDLIQAVKIKMGWAAS
jgi:O-antigen/teichoic acid export membrane protein